MKPRKVMVTAILSVLFFVAAITVIFAQGVKDLTYPGKTEGDVSFKHSTHVTEKKMACKDCHPGIFKMKQGTSGITMDSINKGEFCAKCHNGTKAFDVKPKGNCSKCHAAKK